jgi:phosphohistidine phosphatase
MQIYILRHAEAEPRSAGVAEKDRALTSRGKRDLRDVLALARAARVAPQAILTSPWKRAQQTAAAAAKAFGAPVKETRRLLPSTPPDRTWQELSAIEGDAVMLVGHEPHLSNLMRFLLESALAVDLKKGALARIDTRNRTGPPRGVLKWLITPKLARAR